MPDPTFKIDSTTVLSKSGTTVSVDSGLNIKPAFSSVDTSASRGPSGTESGGTTSTTLPIFGIRAFVHFDGDDTASVGGETHCAIKASGNVSKVVRNGTGDYTVHFAIAMPDAHYAVSHSAADDSDQAQGRMNYDCTFATGSYRFKGTMNTSNALMDSKDNTVIVVR